ncbi:MAG: hypothetical protein KJ017_00995 [Alphaproteobacteria bacterium]|nr:hypothetical protein [Alphaproteobacteria bacterium]
MPRTNRPPKNPYCRRSKLSKEAFEGLMVAYLRNTDAQETAALLYRECGAKISRQSVNKYFLNLGYHLFLNFYVPDAFLVFEADALERAGWPRAALRERGLHYAYHLELVEEMSAALNMRREDLEATHARIMSVPATLKRHIEEDIPSVQDVIETTPDGAMLRRLRDNHFMVSAIRLMRKRAYGYGGEHFLAYFGKAYFMDVFAFASEGAKTDSEMLLTRWTPFTLRIWLGLLLELHPLTLREPMEYVRTIEARFNGESGTRSS